MSEYSKELDGMLMTLKGEVSYIAAFPGTFVTHTEEEARATAERFKRLAGVAIYRIEVIDVVAHVPDPQDAPEALGPKVG